MLVVINSSATAAQIEEISMLLHANGLTSHIGTGKRSLVARLSYAAVAAGADGLLVEVHPDPERAQSAGAQSLNLQEFCHMMHQLQSVSQVVGRVVGSTAAATPNPDLVWS